MTAPAARFALVPTDRLLPHEEVDEEQVAKLVDRLRKDQRLHQPLVADEGTLVVLDGHHRLEALRRLDCRLVPCHLVDYQDPAIRVERWEDGSPMDKDQLISDAMDGELYPVKTSRHRTLRVLAPQPTDLAQLRPRGEVGA